MGTPGERSIHFSDFDARCREHFIKKNIIFHSRIKLMGIFKKWMGVKGEQA